MDEDVRNGRVGIGAERQRAPDGANAGLARDMQRDQLIQPQQLEMRLRDYNDDVQNGKDCEGAPRRTRDALLEPTAPLEGRWVPASSPHPRAFEFDIAHAASSLSSAISGSEIVSLAGAALSS